MIWVKVLHSISAGLPCYEIQKKTMNVRTGLMSLVATHNVATHKIVFFTVIYLLCHPGVSLAWKLNPNTAVEPNKIRVEYQPGNIDNTDLITLHINPRTILEFHIHEDGNTIYMKDALASIQWIRYMMTLHPSHTVSNGLLELPFIHPMFVPSRSAGVGASSLNTHTMSVPQFSQQMHILSYSHDAIFKKLVELSAKLHAKDNQQPPARQRQSGQLVPPESTTSMPDTNARSKKPEAQIRQLEEQNKKLEGYKRKCREYQETLGQEKDKRRQQNLKLKEADKKVAEAEQTIRDRDDNIKTLENTLEELHRSFDKQETRLTFAQDEIKLLSQQLAQQQQQFTEQQQMVTELSAKKKELTRVCRNLECMEAEQRRSAESARKRASEIQAKFHQLKRQSKIEAENSQQALKAKKEKNRQQKEQIDKPGQLTDTQKKDTVLQSPVPATETSKPDTTGAMVGVQTVGVQTVGVQTVGVQTDPQQIRLIPGDTKIAPVIVAGSGGPSVNSITTGNNPGQPEEPGDGEKTRTPGDGSPKPSTADPQESKLSKGTERSNTGKAWWLIDYWNQPGIKLMFSFFAAGTACFVTAFFLYQKKRILSQDKELKHLKDKLIAEKQRKAFKTGDAPEQTTVIPSSHHCYFLRPDSKLRPACEYLESRNDLNMTYFAPLLRTISEQYKESLIYPRFCWYYWTDTGTEPITLKTLVNKLYERPAERQFLLNSLHLQTCKSAEFYHESAEQQARMLRALVIAFRLTGHVKRGWKVLYDSALDRDTFALLLGLVRLALQIDRRDQDWYQTGLNDQIGLLGKRLLTQIFHQETSAHPVSQTAVGQMDAYLIVEPGSEKPLLMPGYFHQEPKVAEKLENLPHYCTTIPASPLKTQCYGYLSEGEYWKVKATGMLQDYILGYLPVLIPDSQGWLLAHYPSLTDQERSDGISSLLAWIDEYHGTARYSEKSGFLKSALALAGFSTADNDQQHLQILSRLWQMQLDNNHWTKDRWAERLLNMPRSEDADKPELILQPLWRQDQNDDEWLLTLKPNLVGQTFENIISDAQFWIHVKYPDDVPESWITHVWIPDLSEWQAQLNTTNRMPLYIKNLGTIDLLCSLAYAFGPLADELEVFFVYDALCRLIPSGFSDFTPKGLYRFIVE